ncbi:hypothetical protein [Microbacterium hydrothermale]|uniref:hypothetical protein n=1 Tax=Microbacterium hydrothermale TaxID=857427 RepID=UPI0010A7E6DD|nr:hypothetical protein [Microbacterium hydrothermale]
MNTSTPLDPRSLAQRLTTVGHALHHRLFAQLRDGDLHPKTVFLLRAIDGRVDAPWVAARLARGGKRVSALADRGWITSTDDGWTLTDEGRAVLDRADAARAALLADVPAEELERLTAALDAVSAALGLDETDGDPRGAFGPAARGAGHGFGPFGRGFGPGRRGFGPRFGAEAHAFGPGERGGEHGHGVGHERGFARGEAGRGDAPAHDPRDRAGRGCAPAQDGAGQERGHHRGHRPGDRHAAQRAYERGFDAGFSRGRASAASAETPAAGEASATE